MKGKGSQNRFMRILALPMRCLTGTRDCYVSGMTNFAVANHPKTKRVPRSYSSSSYGSTDSEDFRELLKAASTRGMESRIELERLMQQYMRQQSAAAAAAMRLSRKVPRSSSVAMGRIDEESGTGEEDESVKYPRSKSYAVVPNKGSSMIAF